jgi:hypothetical protein
MPQPKFNAGDHIIWDNKEWYVVNAEGEPHIRYELKPASDNIWKCGYTGSQIIDKTATKIETAATPGGSVRSRKNRRSKNRQRNSAKRQ